MFVCIVVGYRSILKIWFRISQTSANKFLRAFWMIYTPCVWKEISGNRKRNLIRKGKISKTVSSLIVHFVRAERCIRESFEGKSSRIIPSGVRDRLRKWHIVKSDGESSDARGSRLTDSSDVGWMVLDVIAREITRRFERAHLSPPRHLPLFPPSLTLPPSPLHNLSSPEVHRYFTYHDTYFSPTFVGETRVSSTPRYSTPPSSPPPLPPQANPCGIEGSQLSYPICPYFS